MLPLQLTVLFLAFVSPALTQRVPDPLPLVTPPDVVNLFIQDSDDGAGGFVASVIAADSTAATYRIDCATTRSCGFADWENPIIMTQGLSTFHWSYMETDNNGFTLSERCTFNGTTASIAICTNSYGDDFSLVTNEATTQDPITTQTYDGKVATDLYGHSSLDFGRSLNGPPAFIPVKITAGLASLSAFRAAVTTTGSLTSTSGSSSQATASPTITSLAKSTSSTISIASSGSSSVIAPSAGNTTTKGNSGQNLKVGWELGVVAVIAYAAT